MTILDTLITDRTQADRNRVKSLAAKAWKGMTEAERAEWLAGPVGAYKYTDWNRVESAVEYLAGILRELPDELETLCKENGIHLSDILTIQYDPAEYDLETKTDWTVEDIPRIVEMRRYLDNVIKLRAALDYVTDDLPERMEDLSIDGANAIERALVGLKGAVDELIDKVNTFIRQIVGSFKRTGQFTFWSGYQPLPASISDKGRTWEELDAMQTTWRNWQVADWFLLLYGNLKAEGDVE